MSDAADPVIKQVLSKKIVESIEKPIPAGSPRLVPGLVQFSGKATAVIGMRRSGKTYFLHQLRREKIQLGATQESVPYINFEDERLSGLQGSELGFIVDQYQNLYPRAASQGKTLWCLDEIQLVPGWERFVRRMLDTNECEIMVSGSSAAMLSREIATSLRGRGWEVLMFPFSFAEFLLSKNIELPKRLDFYNKRKFEIERLFSEWLQVGGFPEAQGIETEVRRQLLERFVDVVTYKDVIERHSVRSTTALHWLVRHLLGNAAGTFSVEKFYATLKSQGIPTSKDTLHQLLSYLEDCFLVRIISIETSSERKRMVNPRKSYPVDAGLIPVYDRSGKANTGHSLETAVLIELERRRCKVSYVRTKSGYEVDFMAYNQHGEQELVQVCVDASDSETAKRELRALEEAGEEFPNAKKRLLVLRQDCFPSLAPEDVTIQTAYEWMLDVEYVHAHA